jgi:formylglycine-generating enzyme required for sulfatase activity
MRYIPSGTFTIIPIIYGFVDSDNPEDYTLEKGFWMSETEVTQKLFQSVMGYNNSFYKYDLSPIENITFAEAIVFCNRLSQLSGIEPSYEFPGVTDWFSLTYASIRNMHVDSVYISPTASGYRIPDEFEWQWAAIGADKGGFNSTGYRKYYAGGPVEVMDGIENYAWVRINSGRITHEVGKKLPNEMGLYDMTGNVWEFVSSRWAMGQGAFSTEIMIENFLLLLSVSNTQNDVTPIGIRLVSYR